MRLRVALCTMLALVFISPSIAAANPLNDVVQSWVAFNGVKSYHADMKTENGTASMDLVKPNKMHITAPNGMEVIVIAGDVWMHRTGSWMHVPVPAQRMNMWTGGAAGMGLNGKPSPESAVVAFVGNDATGAHYTVTQKTTGDVTDMWIGGNHLPVQVVTHPKDGSSATITFSKFNAVPDITPPQ